MLIGSSGVPLPPLGEHELLVFWVQVVVLLLAARGGGYLMRRIGQPRVIGELLAGVALGPSFAGELFPTAWNWIFPADERQSGLLLGLAWFGIVMVLMTTGAESDLSLVRKQGRATLTTAVGSLVVPLGAGVALGLWLPDAYLGSEGSRGVFAVFIGIALAISSLPVAARILGDLGILHLPLSQLIITVALTNDVVGWLLLGAVVRVAENGTVDLTEVAVSVVGLSAVAVAILGFGPRALDFSFKEAVRRDGGPAATASIAVLFTVAVGALTHALGLEVVVGAFLAGIAIGKSRIAKQSAMVQLETVTDAVFAPLFFAVAGVRVDLGALDDRSLVIAAVLVTLVATTAKLVGAYAGARLSSMSRRDAFGAGAALNARGALEIVVATVGLSIGVLSDAAYSAIVLMAIATSAMAGPMLRGHSRYRPARGLGDPGGNRT